MVRLGRVTKKWRMRSKPLFHKDDNTSTTTSSPSSSSTSKKDPFTDPSPHTPPAVGQLSSNQISSIYAPLFFELAIRQSEEHASEMLRYEEELSMIRSLEEKMVGDEDDRVVEDIMPEGKGNGEGNSTLLPPLPSSGMFLFASRTSMENFEEGILNPTMKHFGMDSSVGSGRSKRGSPVPPWKVHANAAKFERLLDEKYGRLRPFLTSHPEVETFLRSTQRQYHRGEFSPFRPGDPPLDFKASLVLLFMMHRNSVRFEVTALAGLFLLVGLQPWALVMLVVAARYEILKRRKRKVAGWMDDRNKVKLTRSYYDAVYQEEEQNNNLKESCNDTKVETVSTDKSVAKHDLLLRPVGTSLTDNEAFDAKSNDHGEAYDTIVVGSGPATLFASALLSRTGRTVLVLCPDEDASGVQMIKENVNISQNGDSVDDDNKGGKNKTKEKSKGDWTNVPFDIASNNLSHISSQQQLLSPALATSTDAQGGVRFARIGSEADGFATDVLSIPGVGGGGDVINNGGAAVLDGEGNAFAPALASKSSSWSLPFPLRGGALGIAEDAAATLGDGWPGSTNQDDGGEKQQSNQIGNSSLMVYTTACEGINVSSDDYYLTKLMPQFVNKFRKDPPYGEAGMRYASLFLDKVLPLNAHVRSLAAGMGMRGECLPPGNTSMAVHASNVSALASPEGFAYPVGGPRALCMALATIVEQNGGKIMTDVDIDEFLFHEKIETNQESNDCEDEGGDGDNDGNNSNDNSNKNGIIIGSCNAKKESTNNKKKKKVKKNDESKSEEKSEIDSNSNDCDTKSSKPRCHGVRLKDGRIMSVGHDDEDAAIVSMLGFMETFVFHCSDDLRSKHGVPAGLPVLTERRPQLHFMYGLRGNAENLGLTGADWYRLPNAALAKDGVDPTTGQIKLGTIGADMLEDENEEEGGCDPAAPTSSDLEKINNSTLSDSCGSRVAGRDKQGRTRIIAKSPTADNTSRSKRQTRRKKFTSGYSWMKVSFPSAKDPSWRERYDGKSTCVVTVEADDDFVRMFDTSPKLYSITKFGPGECQRLRERVEKDLLETFPQLKGVIECTRVHGPARMGLSHTPQRYAASGIRPDSPFPGLFLGGSDLTMGDSLSASNLGAWMVANAVVKYSYFDHLFLHKNITNDILQFLEHPIKKKRDSEDIAVPFTV